jgi:hypothetical protein
MGISTDEIVSLCNVVSTDTHFGIHPFYIRKGIYLTIDYFVSIKTKLVWLKVIHYLLFQLGTVHTIADNFTFSAPTASLNVSRVLRGLQLNKPILLEGSPGVGKTSLVVALAKAAGYHLTRINVSDQTVSVSVTKPSLNRMKSNSRFELCIKQSSLLSIE